jgi:hypothetical protein
MKVFQGELHVFPAGHFEFEKKYNRTIFVSGKLALASNPRLPSTVCE